MIKKTKIFIGVGIITLSAALFIGYSTFSSSNNYPEKEYSVQQSVINTFNINTKDYKPLFTKDVFDNNIATEPSEIRGKIANSISILTDDGDLKVGDFQPMIFLKGNDEVLIGIKHPDETITLIEFDISKEKPVKGEKQVKAISK
jgi:hypothetical protein